MQLPEDVLTIIRAYSKPSFVYFREYNHILKLHNLQEWTTLKELLFGSLKEEMIYHLRIYIKALEEWYSAMKTPSTEWNDETMKKMCTVSDVFSGLTLLMYGEVRDHNELIDKFHKNRWV